MSIRERILTVYKNQRPERRPVSIYKRYLKVGELERLARNSGLGILDFVPVVSLMAPAWHLAPGYISEVKNVSLSVSYSWENGRLVQVRTYATPVGSVSARIVRDEVTGSEWMEKHYIESPDDYKIIQFIIEHTIFLPQEDLVRSAKRDLGDDGIVLGRIDRIPYQKLLIELADPEVFLVDIQTRPEIVRELLEVMEARLDEQVLKAMESSAAVIWSPDNVTSDMTPPRLYKTHCLPFYERYHGMCRGSGKIYCVHLDGRLAALKELIARSRFDVIDSFSLIEVGGDMSISEAKLAWPDKVLCPNLPASICLKPPEEIKTYLKNISAGFGDRPFMLQISEDIPPDSYENVLPALTSQW
jgi:hypothetical protein